jgi:hypothetical protein
MYVPSQNVENPETEVYCALTGESYAYISGHEYSLLDPKICEGAIDNLPERFFKQLWVIRSNNGQIRVFGRVE